MGNETLKQLRESISPHTTTSLGQLAEAKAARDEAMRSFLLLDCSGSMGEYCEPNRPKIVALREIVESLKASGLMFTQVIFPGTNAGAEMSGTIPHPGGGTPLHAALEVANVEGAKHIVLISDGLPDHATNAQFCAEGLKRKGVKIDVFYVGPYPHEGEKFLHGLSTITSGQFQKTSLKASQQKGLTQRVKTALLGTLHPTS